MQKTILITGAAKGIGNYCALGLKARGYQVFATARSPADLAALQAQGLQAISLDLNNTASIKQAIDQVLQATGGKLDFLLNNAGFGQPGAVEDLSRDTIRKQFETNVFGAIELINMVIPTLRRQGSGRIVNISSILGIVTIPYRGAYNASKFALEGFSDTLRQELHGSGIRVILIEPGAIISNFRAAAFTAYQQNINAADSAHRNNYQTLEKYYGTTAESPLTAGQSPELVLQALIHALENPRPKIRYYVTPAAHVLSSLKRILPTRMLDWILRRVSEGKKAKNASQ